ncbi:MAG: CopD family protein [Planctomycetota bacterium]|jgi:putative membrane protein
MQVLLATLEFYPWAKWLHLLGVVLYAGGLLALTRLLGHAVRYEAAASRADAYRTFKRMHVLVDWAGLVLMVGTGLWLLLADPLHKAYFKQGYFHLKLTCIVVLIVCDVLLTAKLFRLRGEGPQPGPNFFRILHGVAGLALLGALAAVFVVRG